MEPTNKPESQAQTASKAAFNPALMMLAIALIAAVLTYVLPSGEYRRNGKPVVPGTYQVLEKNMPPHGWWSAFWR